jgi:hypothetical protein
VLPHWPSSRRLGLGGIPDFNALIATDPTSGAPIDPQFTAAWSDVKAQLIAEGQTNFTAAKIALADSFTQMSSQLGVDPGEAYNAARDYVKLGHTVQGAINSAQNLMSLAQGGNPVAFVNQFTGTMIGLATSLGSLSLGAGAAIVGAVGTILTVLEKVGLFGGPPPAGGYSPNGIPYGVKPQFLVGDLGGWAIGTSQQIAPGASTWRPFPDRTSQDDSAWFARGHNGVGQWRNGWFGYGGPGGSPDWHPNPYERPIESAFPIYSFSAVSGGSGRLGGQYGIEEMETLPGADPALSNPFAKAFCAAWKLNAAYSFNGLQALPDWQVLVHALRVWNRSHSSDTTTTIGRQTYGGGAGYGPPWGYIGGLAGAVIDANTKDLIGVNADSLTVNTGEVIDLSTLAAKLPPPPPPGGTVNVVVPTGSSGGMTTGGKIAVGGVALAGAALLSTGVYAAVKHKTLNDVWRDVKRTVRR